MRRKIEYYTDQERQQVLEANADLILVEEQNITEGNFLIFSDKPLPERIIYTKVPVAELESIKQSIAELTILLATPTV